MDNLQREEERLLENKMLTITSDISDRLSDMRRIALQIGVNDKFHKQKIDEHKYYEIEAVKQLKAYQENVNVLDNIFVLYDSYDRVFTSYGSTLSLDNYLSKKLQIQNKTEIVNLMTEIAESEQKEPWVCAIDNQILYLFALKAYGRDNGVIGFSMSVEELTDRIKFVAGNIDGTICILYKNSVLFGDEDILLEEDTLMIKEDSNIRCYGIINNMSYDLLKEKVFSGKMDILILGISLALCGAILVSYWNYIPYKRIENKYSKDSKSNWEDFERELDKLFYERDIKYKLLNEQYLLLREKMILQIIDDGYDEWMDKYIVLLDIKIMHCVISIISVKFQDGQDLEIVKSEQKNPWIISEQISNTYFAWASKNHMYVLLTAEQELDAYSAAEELKVILNEMNYQADVTVKGTGNNLNDLNGSKCEKIAYQSQPEEGFGDIEEVVDRAIMKSRGIPLVFGAIEYINMHYTESDLSLNRVSEYVHCTPQYLSGKFKETVGMTYREYLSELRIQKAKKIILNEDITVGEVCNRVGWINVSYFIKVFQEKIGETPGSYRQQQLIKMQERDIRDT